MRRWAVAAAAAIFLAGCSGGGDPDPGPTTTPTPSVLPSATPVPGPAAEACYRLAYGEALAPTNDRPAVDCDRRHTSQTYAVGRVDTVVDGHLLAIDSTRVREQVARTCPEQLGGFVGGDEDDLRLSMLRAVWFTPTVEQSDAGADWYRCDVIAVAGTDDLATVTGRLDGVLDEQEGRDRWGMCGTAAPDARDFARVLCSSDHAWRAVSVVELPDGGYPGEADVREAGQTPCQDAGRDAAEDPLDYQWGYEWPTAEQWAAGQTYGRCWAPD
ncbi:septum formation family protein [Nocardioides lianchengensis]|uniref:Septum formation n=1 Tax=Nocardioides lianchengensis TaxID=1045774 RepID=A0A1G6WV28_9ACTN|nr:septum formation family protein [Nocardioides lianchengensis]NYG09207.1 hypothetical protein [Nocardioides lianchengensis]SDD69047.1 Septum formation [Nocardioides lianchengensis]